MSSETQSCELLFTETKSEKSQKVVILTKKKLILLIVVTVLSLGILIIPIFVPKYLAILIQFSHFILSNLVLVINHKQCPIFINQLTYSEIDDILYSYSATRGF